MRLGVSLSIGLCAAALLAGCSKPADTSQAPAADTGAASPPPAAAPTEADRKAILATLPPAFQTADLDNGQAKFALCKSCHTVSPGGDSGVGPNLYGVFGRKAGTLAGFSYSDGIKALGITWDADRIDTWITRPSAMVHGTKMTYAGMVDPKDRTDVVAYLKVITTPASR